jgi:recombinational DNA repair protein (RecF pathway)
MPYHRYETDAFVLAVAPVRERDRLYSLLTRDFGLVKAVAAGALMPHSRLAPHLPKAGRLKVSLVKGKGSWRIVGTRDSESGWAAFRSTPSARQAYLRVLRFLRIALYEEDRHPEIFDVLDALRTALATAASDNIHAMEVMAVGRLLSELGHLELPAVLAQGPLFSVEALQAAGPGGEFSVLVNETLRRVFP